MLFTDFFPGLFLCQRCCKALHYDRYVNILRADACALAAAYAGCRLFIFRQAGHIGPDSEIVLSKECIVLSNDAGYIEFHRAAVAAVSEAEALIKGDTNNLRRASLDMSSSQYNDLKEKVEFALAQRLAFIHGPEIFFSLGYIAHT